MIRTLAATAIILAAIGTPALAQRGLSGRYLACTARAHHSTVQEGICAQAEMAAQDARLNKAYQQVMRQLASRPGERLALRDAQRSWIRRRDYACQIDRQTIDNICLVTRTASRADELERRIRF